MGLTEDVRHSRPSSAGKANAELCHKTSTAQAPAMVAFSMSPAHRLTRDILPGKSLSRQARRMPSTPVRPTITGTGSGGVFW